jgi:hypothetical protein
MRGGDDNQQEGMFRYVSPEKRVLADHPLRPLRKIADEILKEMSPQFAKLYSDVGRQSIAPERLLRSFNAHRAIGFWDVLKNLSKLFYRQHNWLTHALRDAFYPHEAHRVALIL